MLALPVLIAAAVAQAALPTADVGVPRFTSIEIVGGGEIVLRHGSRQRVTLTGARPELTQMTVDDRGRLKVDVCSGTCSGGRTPRIEIVTPEALEAISLRGGGRLRGEGSWPAQKSVAVAASAGGTIDLTELPADTVVAAASGGGEIAASPRAALVATTSNGGTIRYRGTPRVTTTIAGGGTVTRIRD